LSGDSRGAATFRPAATFQTAATAEWLLPVALLSLAESANWTVPCEEFLFGLMKPLGFIVPAIVSRIGIGLAVAGLLSNACRRSTAVAGLIVNVITLLALVLLLLW
jgi:hypothetical protein